MVNLGVYSCFFGMVGAVLKDENLFEMAGVTYHALHRKTCIGCAFEFSDPCIVSETQPFCMSSMRDDNTDVIWQQENHD
jgi:hypothetical protein